MKQPTAKTVCYLVLALLGVLTLCGMCQLTTLLALLVK